MRTFSMFFVVLALGIGCVAGQSVKSCGSDSDHLKKVSIKMNPDPPVKGQDFTMELTGELDEDITGGSIDVDLSITALKIIKSHNQQQTPFTYEPGFKKGPMKLTIGPTQLPKMPGSASVQGQVHVKDAKGEAMACVDINLNMGSESEDSESAADVIDGSLGQVAQPLVTGVDSCTKASDHLKDFNLNTDGGAVNMSGSLDEALETLKLNLDLKIKKFIVHIPLQMSVPITFSPVIPSGPFRFAAGPATGSITPDPKVTITGQITAGDGKDEEVFCLNVDNVVENVVV